MKARRNAYVAHEGIPFLLSCLALAAIGWRLGGPLWIVPGALLFVLFAVVFRDPDRAIPAAPLGVVSPVDGIVTEIGVSDCGAVDGEVHRILIAIGAFGSYSARSPVEGKIMDLHCEPPRHARSAAPRGLWIRTDENEDVVLQFHGYRCGIAPRALQGFGERVGQGQRCAWLRLTRLAEVQLPLPGRVLVQAGQRVRAGTDLLAKLPHH